MGLPRLWGEEIGWGRGVVVTRTEYLVEQGQERLDLFLVRKGPGLTRSQVRRLLDEGYVQLNGEAPKPSRKIQAGDLITLIVASAKAGRHCAGSHTSKHCVPRWTVAGG